MSHWTMDLPWQVDKIIAMLNDNGYDAYVVGGCVRDALLKKTPHDYDVATSATSDVVTSIFATCKVIPTGLKHGTVSVIMDHLTVEITTYRIESEYQNHRWPKSVAFTTSLQEDLKRRDFTINAFAYHPIYGLVDYFDGQGDLLSGLIRTVGDAKKRFHEDALRIVRCIRFGSTLGFAIEEETAKQAIGQRSLLDAIAWERKSEEFLKLLGGDAFDVMFLQYHEIIEKIVPEIKILVDQPPCFRTTISSMKRIAIRDSGVIARFAILLCGMNVEETKVVGLCRRLKLSRQYEQHLVCLVQGIMVIKTDQKAGVQNINRIMIKHWLAKMGVSLVPVLLACLQAMDLIDQNEEKAATEWMQSVIDNKEPYLIKHLAISGQDLIASGVRQGMEVGWMLERALQHVMEFPEKNNVKDLMHLLLGQ